MPVDFKTHISVVPNWPREGITCYDCTPFFQNPQYFHDAIEALARPYLKDNIELVVGIEARGFVVAAALALRLGVGVALIRKKGKLPPPVVNQEYSFEYAAQIMEMQSGAIKPGQRVVLADDTLATGGTMAAAVKLVKKLEANIIGLSFIVEIPNMAGRARLREPNIHSLVTFN